LEDYSVKLAKQGKYKKRGLINSFFNKRHLNATGSFINHNKIKRILDVGCGEGMPLYYLQSKLNDAQIYGIDNDFEKIEMIKRNITKGNFTEGDIYSLPFENKSFDLIICLEVLEHLRFPEKALLEIKRVSSGSCLFSVPYEPIWSFLNVLRLKYLSSLGNTPDHKQKWTFNQFKKFIEKEFNILLAKVVIPWTFILCSPRESQE
jgi:ubiquinone/menaquinone biosynthesis C-methylase UbiE